MYVASPGLLERVAEVVTESDDAKSLFEYLASDLDLDLAIEAGSQDSRK